MIDAQGLRAVYRKEFLEWVRLPALVGADLLGLPINWREEKRGINFPKGDGKIDPSPICSIGCFWPQADAHRCTTQENAASTNASNALSSRISIEKCPKRLGNQIMRGPDGDCRFSRANGFPFSSSG